MPGPNSQGATQGQSGRWWVLDIHSRGFSGLKAIMSASKPPVNPQSNVAAGPFLSQTAAQNWIKQNQTTASSLGLDPTSWLSDIGGKLASGIESGVVQVLKDLWNVIVGPLEVFAGIAIAIFVFIIYFKDDIMKLAPMIMMAAA